MKAVALIGVLLAARAGAAAIHGSVIDSIGKPVAHAQVAAYAVEEDLARMDRIVKGRPRTELAKATTAEDGTFSLDVSAYRHRHRRIPVTVIEGVTTPVSLDP